MTSLKESSPKRSAFEILESSLLKIFLSILWSLMKSVSRLFFEKLGQWRRQCIVVSTVPQLQIRFNLSWKLCLDLWNRGWLKPNLSFAISFKPSRQWQWKVLFAEGLMKAYIRFLKIAQEFQEVRFLKITQKRPSKFLILESKFHSIIVEGKKWFFKQSYLTLKRGILFLFLVI